ncbi:ATP-binding protein [Pedobacter steynii]
MKVKTEIAAFTIYANRSLIEIIVNNLFSNAIRHNYDGGSIQISLFEDSLIFSNTSTQTGLHPVKIFERFYKDNTSDGTGLGLAILKQVCLRQHYQLSYHYEQKQHQFKIIFNSQENSI